MTGRGVDLDKLRVALRRMSRSKLLMVAERAIDIVPKAKLIALVGDLVPLDDLAEGKRGAAALLAEVRKFHEAGLKGEYYESFNVNSKNFMEKSEGTEAFIAEFDRLIGRVVLETYDALASAAASGKPYVSPLGPPRRAT
jgi:hypothetical protein